MRASDMETLLLLWANQYGDCTLKRGEGLHAYHVRIATKRNWADDYFLTADAAMNFISYRVGAR